MQENTAWIAVLVGIVSTTQLHLAKALERQGIEIFELLRARLKKAGDKVEGSYRKGIIYAIGLILNNTIFIYPIIAQRFAPPAAYTSMFGFGLVFLMIYAVRVLHEKVNRFQVAGSIAITLGTLVIGIQNALQKDYDRSGMILVPTLALVGTFLLVGIISLILVNRAKKPEWIAITFGLFCGGCGSLDPFLKGVAQNMSGQPEWLPVSWFGWALFISSFVIGFVAFLVTQVGFSRKAPASILVPAYNANYILLPVILQKVLLPGTPFHWSSALGIICIILGMLLMGKLDLGRAPH